MRQPTRQRDLRAAALLGALGVLAPSREANASPSPANTAEPGDLPLQLRFDVGLTALRYAPNLDVSPSVPTAVPGLGDHPIHGGKGLLGAEAGPTLELRTAGGWVIPLFGFHVGIPFAYSYARRTALAGGASFMRDGVLSLVRVDLPGIGFETDVRAVRVGAVLAFGYGVLSTSGALSDGTAPEPAAADRESLLVSGELRLCSAPSHVSFCAYLAPLFYGLRAGMNGGSLGVRVVYARSPGS